MSNTTESESADGPCPATGRNKGQSLVEAFRVARIAQRPALRMELRERRQALRESWAAQIRNAKPKSAPAQDVVPAEPMEMAGASTAEPTMVAEIGASIFAGYCGAVDVAAIIATVPLQTTAPQSDNSVPSPPEFKTDTVDLPLSAIGFGPGMTMRMAQLGIRTVSELASSDAAWLRNALGEISQLINVDLWIGNARRAASGEATPSDSPGTPDVTNQPPDTG